MRTPRITISALCFAALAGCGGSDAVPEGDSLAQNTSRASVTITSPVEGDTVTLPFTISLMASGVEVVVATGTAEPGKGHHHLVIDGEAPSDSLPLPAAPLVIHLGTGASEYVVDSLSPGPHRIIAIFAAGDHVAIQSVARDTLNVVVR